MDYHRRCRRVATFLAATLCLVVLHEGRCGTAARPLRRLQAAEERTVLDVAAAAEAPEQGVTSGGDAVLGAGKWLPMPMFPGAASGLRFPPVPALFPGAAAAASMPWLAGAPPAFAGLPAPLVPPYVGATRQEQLSLWASLFNPMQVRPRLPTASTLSGVGGQTTTTTTGGQQVVDREAPAIASGGKAAAVEGDTMDQLPAAGGAVQVGEPKWGVFLGNIDHRN